MIQFLPYAYNRRMYGYKKRMELTCFIYTLICLCIYLFSLHKKLSLTNMNDLLHTYFRLSSPFRYIYQPPKDENNNTTTNIVLFFIHISTIFLLGTTFFSVFRLQNHTNSLYFMFTLCIWLFIYKLDVMTHQRYPVIMENNAVNLPINLPFLDLTGLFNQNINDIEMIIQIDGEIQELDREQFENYGIRLGNIDTNHNRPNNNRRRQGVRNDRQNVHDSGVTATIKKSVSNLKNKTDLTITPEETLAQLAVLIDNCEDTLIKEKAKKTLETIEKSSIPLVSIGMTMAEVIQLFWNRVNNSNFTTEQQNLLKENLIKELADGSTLSIKPVCSTGIVSRIIQSGIEIDKEIDIKPKWALRQELLQESYKIWKNLYQKLSKEEKIAINSLKPDENEIIVVNKFKGDLNKSIREKAHKTYVEAGLLNKIEVDRELNGWIEEIV